MQQEIFFNSILKIDELQKEIKDLVVFKTKTESELHMSWRQVSDNMDKINGLRTMGQDLRQAQNDFEIVKQRTVELTTRMSDFERKTFQFDAHFEKTNQALANLNQVIDLKLDALSESFKKITSVVELSRDQNLTQEKDLESLDKRIKEMGNKISGYVKVFSWGIPILLAIMQYITTLLK